MALRHAGDVHHAPDRRRRRRGHHQTPGHAHPEVRSAFYGYNRGLHWDRTCAEVTKLRNTRGAQREVAAVVASSSERGGFGSGESDRTERIRYWPLPPQKVPGKAVTSCRRPWS